MKALILKPTHKPVKAYYEVLQQFERIDVTHETAVSTAFQNLLQHCCKQFDWTLVSGWRIKKTNVLVDGAVIDGFKLAHGYWEAKDSDDDLEKEVKKKFGVGYPQDNILFQEPERAILWQDGKQLLDEDISKADNLIETLKLFLEYQPPHFEQWEEAIEHFSKSIPELAGNLVDLIEKERKSNKQFIDAFTQFIELCRQSINPNLSEKAVEEMLIQHMLTERIYRKVFQNPDFVRRNVIAAEIERVIEALTSRAFSREDWLKSLDRFYVALETTASTIDDFTQKQHFLNTVYEKFFRGFSVKVADTHGIVYTPPQIVNFMVKSAEEILKKDFGKSLCDNDVHILDPFVGTGNFIVHIMREIKKTALPYKYAHELHCNEVMLLPYYITSMNIEHEYFEQTGEYKPFEGICLVDTFELAEKRGQVEVPFAANAQRIERQKDSPIFVVIGNPPYNANQVNENDNNKNRTYPVIDERVSNTYASASQATLLNKLRDPYVKAIRWASDRIGQEGVVAFVTNNSLIDQIAFDGMRKHLAQDFDTVYILDLGGNVRKNPKLSGTTHNVFGIQVGVSINFFVRKKHDSKRSARIFYARLDEFWRKEQKFEFLETHEQYRKLKWQELMPDKDSTWLTEGLEKDFGAFLQLGSKESKQKDLKKQKTIFGLFSLGVSTNRDDVVYDFNKEKLAERVKVFCDDYNAESSRYKSKGKPKDVDTFIDYNKLKWSSTLKSHLVSGLTAVYDEEQIRRSLYRPFTSRFLYYDTTLNDRPGLFRNIIPQLESNNKIICLSAGSNTKPFHCLMSKIIPDLHLTGDTQCFPFYTYDEDGTNRRENITDWASAVFRDHYKAKGISKWDIFCYIYAILHHPKYREKYSANLKRELPRAPFALDFWSFAEAGKNLADLHVNYGDQKEYPLKRIENKDVPLNWRVEKMKPTKDKKAIIYNEFLTLHGIPPEAFEYRLGNRSALEWVIDQYQVSTDKRSGITNDPNRDDDLEYIVRLIGKVITVSVETVKIVNGLPNLE